MHKAAVRHGDPTTTRGFVIAYSSTMFDNGRQVALSGDEATCGECEGAYKIYGTGVGMSEQNRSVVVEGDRVLCPCGKNRVMVGANPGIFLEVDSDANARSNDAGGEDSHWITFALSERGSCEGLSCVARFADGSIERAVIDANNRVRFARTTGSVCQYFEVTAAENEVPTGSVAEALLAAVRC
jgi:hypothetical protein